MAKGAARLPAAARAARPSSAQRPMAVKSCGRMAKPSAIPLLLRRRSAANASRDGR